MLGWSAVITIGKLLIGTLVIGAGGLTGGGEVVLAPVSDFCCRKVGVWDTLLAKIDVAATKTRRFDVKLFMSSLPQ